MMYPKLCAFSLRRWRLALLAPEGLAAATAQLVSAEAR
jgi:hypothetical protein